MSFKPKNSPYYYISVPGPDGKRRRVTTKFTRKAQADLAEARARTAFAFRLNGIPNLDAGKAHTFQELHDWYWRDHGSKLVSQTLKGTMEKHVLPVLGPLTLDKVTKGTLEKLLDALEPVLALRTRRHIRTKISRMHTLASTADIPLWSGPSPTAGLKMKKPPKKRKDFLRLSEVGPFLAAAESTWRWIFAVALYTAMRWGEIVALRKADIDWESMEILVGRSWDRDVPKGNVDLAIPIARDLVPYLRAAVEATDSLLVFPAASGEMLSRGTKVNRRIATALKRAGLVVGYRHLCRRCKFSETRQSGTVTRCPKCSYKLLPLPIHRSITIHRLRHTTGTLLAKNGVPLKTIQQVLRHADIEVTAEHYTDIDLEDARKAVDSTLSGLPGRPGAHDEAIFREPVVGPR